MKKPCCPKVRIRSQPPQGVGKRRPRPVLALVPGSDHRADIPTGAAQLGGQLGFIEEFHGGEKNFQETFLG